MRNVILSLALANVLLLAWERWVKPAEVADPAVFAGRVDEPSVPKLVLYNPEGLVPPTTPPQPVMAPAVDTLRCERIGPFANPEPAASIAQQLGERGLKVDLVHETGDIWVGQWVQVIGMESGDQAREAVERLVAAGLNDAYIVRTEPTIDISLGVFRGAAGAEQVMRVARAAGLEPSQSDRFRTGTQHWVSVELRGQEALDLTDLQLQWSQILRTENVACRPTADETVADGGGGSLESLADAGEPE